MTKSEFLSHPGINALIEWVSERFEEGFGWQHSYTKRASGARWSCSSLSDASRQYEWNGKPWKTNVEELARYRDQLRAGRLNRDPDAVFRACEAVLRWGGVWANNGHTLAAGRQHLLDELLHMSAVLTADETPSSAGMRRDPRDPETVCSLNAGFVKIYSVLLDHCVIYDGRVGAALGLLARQYCEAAGLKALPQELAFAYGVAKEARNARSPKRRDPSGDGFRFPKLRQDARFHAEHTMRANWFLRAALDRNPRPFGAGEAGFHQLAAGLFMVGYDLTDAVVDDVPPKVN